VLPESVNVPQWRPSLNGVLKMNAVRRQAEKMLREETGLRPRTVLREVLPQSPVYFLPIGVTPAISVVVKNAAARQIRKCRNIGHPLPVGV
jgi:hypothetical protein